MDVELVFHCDPVDDDQRICWWIEVPQLDGFYAAGETATEARENARAALRDQLGDTLGTIRERLADGVAVDYGDHTVNQVTTPIAATAAA